VRDLSVVLDDEWLGSARSQDLHVVGRASVGDLERRQYGVAPIEYGPRLGEEPVTVKGNHGEQRVHTRRENKCGSGGLMPDDLLGIVVIADEDGTGRRSARDWSGIGLRPDRGGDGRGGRRRTCQAQNCSQCESETGPVRAHNLQKLGSNATASPFSSVVSHESRPLKLFAQSAPPPATPMCDGNMSRP
jgi:hypothetical protein